MPRERSHREPDRVLRADAIRGTAGRSNSRGRRIGDPARRSRASQLAAVSLARDDLVPVEEQNRPENEDDAGQAGKATGDAHQRDGEGEADREA